MGSRNKFRASGGYINCAWRNQSGELMGTKRSDLSPNDIILQRMLISKALVITLAKYAFNMIEV